MSRKASKLKATSFFRPDFRDNVSDAIKTCHQIAHRASLVLKQYYLEEYEKNPQKITSMDTATIKVAFEVVKDSKSDSLQVRSERKLDRTSKKYAEMSEKEFEKLQKEKTAAKAAGDSLKKCIYDSMLAINNALFPDRVQTNQSLSYILNRRIEMFETSYLNNVIFNFDKYVKRFIRYEFGNKTPTTVNTIKYLFPRSCSKHESCECGKTPCPSESQEFVNTHFGYLQHKKFQDIKELVEKDPWFYLNKMVGMNRLFEDIEATREKKKKLYSPLSIIRSFVPSHIHLDTPGLLQLLVTDATVLNDLKVFYKQETSLELKCKGKVDVCSSYEKLTGDKDPDGEKGAEHFTTMWKFFCRFEDPRYKELLSTTRKSSKGELVEWAFNNFISTDGVSMSAVLCKKSEKRIQEYNSKRKKATLFKKREFQNIQGLESTKMVEILDTKKYLVISIDPGKNNIITASNGQETFKYTSKQRQKDMKLKKRAEKHNQKVNELPALYREDLATTNSSSCYPQNFCEYVKRKFQGYENVKQLYEDSSFRSTKFLAHVLSHASEDKMIHNFKTWIQKLHKEVKKGRQWLQDAGHADETMKKILANALNDHYKKVVLFYGTWGQNPNLKNSAPTPGVGLKRKLAKLFEVIEVGEWMTSQTCPCCRQRNLEHPQFEDKRYKGPRHQLLRCKNADCNCKWWSRDNLGAFNILYKGIEDMKKVRSDQSRSQDNLR